MDPTVTPVKTALLRAIRDALRGIADIKTVIRSPSKPIDRETVGFPVAFMDDTSEEPGRRNRLSWNSFPLVVEVWAEALVTGEDLWDALDWYQAEINQVLLPETGETDPAVLLYSTNVERSRSEKFRVDETLGMIRLEYRVHYAHEWDSPDRTGKALQP